jgi:biotin synthase
MQRAEIESWLREHDPARLEELYRTADQVRRREVGEEVHLRALVEISNMCARSCHYCGIRAGRADLPRYRMGVVEVLACLRRAEGLGFGSAVLQAGEDPGLGRDWVADLVRRIRAETGLAVTLSLGEQAEADLEAWREAGAERYLLRFETSNRELYRRVHPERPGQMGDRLRLLESLRALGYEVGTGMLVGLPGQRVGDLAADLELLGRLEPDMIGLGPFVPDPHTPLGAEPGTPGEDQAPADLETACKALALARLLCPRANIPATTAVACVAPEAGRGLALQRGANVLMPNLTPAHYRALYAIYPRKACLTGEREEDLAVLREEIARLGRVVGRGPGASRAFLERAHAEGGAA